ncbi:VOC family protein [Labrys sp. KNU-23]|uniref:VOC family protein n=1 Tax=Labrys TaxID=204476 RepID=UPI0011EC9F0F|nr:MULTISPECIES: VOC family protein [Labrys]MDT3375967.1 VOC family protein [Labrys neptuniae]QEN90429.1 VOC family protein [Labrys sp. KNU-23]
MKLTVQPFLMFQGQGQADAAMNLYVSLFPDGEILDVERYGAGEMGLPGSIKKARFSIAGQSVMCIDSPVQHNFTFTPSFSFFIDCETSEDLDRLFAALSQDGTVFMALDDYGFSRRFGWVADRFGVSWQINLPFEAPA